MDGVLRRTTSRAQASSVRASTSARNGLLAAARTFVPGGNADAIGGGTGKEQAVFLRALREVVSPIDNPSYLLARRKLWGFFREDYFAVPDAFARKKEFAEMFARRWNRLVGPVQLVYTRTPEGRKLLLRSRNHSLSGAFQKRAERVSCWK